MLLVLGRFDSVNLAHGAQTGDYALGEVGRRMAHFAQDEFARASWLVARIDGGKFLLATRDKCSRERWQFLAETLADAAGKARASTVIGCSERSTAVAAS